MKPYMLVFITVGLLVFWGVLIQCMSRADKDLAECDHVWNIGVSQEDYKKLSPSEMLELIYVPLYQCEVCGLISSLPPAVVTDPYAEFDLTLSDAYDYGISIECEDMAGFHELILAGSAEVADIYIKIGEQEKCFSADEFLDRLGFE